MVGVITLCFVYYIHDYAYPKETITTEIIDKWVDPNLGSAYMYQVELADHRVFSIGSFEYSLLVFHKPYKIEVYKTFVRILEERWRV
jgi:hypothetical protein